MVITFMYFSILRF